MFYRRLMIREDYILKDDEILEVKSDRLFHDLWNENEMDTIEWTAMQILNCNYEDIHGKVKVGNTRLTNASLNEKQKFVDLIVYYEDTITVIELNNNASPNYLRNTLYALNAINNSYIEGEKYTDKKVRGILVNLNWFKNKEKISNKKEIVYGYPILGEEDDDYLLKIININLAYYKDKCYNEFVGVDKLSKLLTINSKERLKEITTSEKLLNNYYNKMNRLSKSKEYCRMIWDERIEKNLRAQQEYYDGKQDGIEEGIELGKQKGIEEGIELGKQKGIEKMIISFYNNGATNELIAKSTGLSIDEIERIVKQEKLD